MVTMNLRETIEDLIKDMKLAKDYLVGDAYYYAEELIEKAYKVIENITVEDKAILGMLSRAKEQLFYALQFVRTRSKVSAYSLLEDVIKTLKEILVIL